MPRRLHVASAKPLISFKSRRIGPLLLSKAAAKRLIAAGVDRAVRGKESASDHSPVWIELRDASSSLRQAASRAVVKPGTAKPEAQGAKVSKKPTAKTSSRRPLLVIDGDSFAHRAYHALPKNIRRNGDRPAGAILGFANLLLRLYREEKPRGVLVAWDTLEAETYRHEAFPAYQSGREFDDDLLQQLAVIPNFVAARGFANARRAGFEADDFLAAAAGRRGATRRHRAGRQRRSRHVPARVG